MDQRTVEWYAFRRSHITASRAAAILGEDPWRTSLDVYREMVDSYQKEMTKAMEDGQNNEPIALRAYEEYTGLLVDPIVVEHPVHQWLGASLDGATFNNNYIVEIKCPGEKSFQEMKKNGIPHYYWIQVQTQLACVPDAKEAHFFVWRDCEFFMEKIVPDKLFHVELIDKLHEFWTDHIVPKIPPSPLVIDDEEYISCESKLLNLIDIKDRIDKEVEDLKNTLKEIDAGRNVQGNYFKVNTYMKKGVLDESLLLRDGIDTSLYRKPCYPCTSVIKIKTNL